jgi:hypothetical protein
MGAVILPFRRRFDPLDPASETRYDSVVDSLNRRAAERRRNVRLAREIERQFVENDLVVAGGKRRGQPLTAEGRRRRIAQLLSLHDEQHRIDAQLQRLGGELESMNTDLEAWARDTYGLGR